MALTYQLNPALFRDAAHQLVKGLKSPKIKPINRGCPLLAIRVLDRSTHGWVEFHFARAFFTAYFRPDNARRGKPWWPVGEIDAPVIALLLAELLAREIIL